MVLYNGELSVLRGGDNEVIIASLFKQFESQISYSLDVFIKQIPLTAGKMLLSESFQGFVG